MDAEAADASSCIRTFAVVGTWASCGLAVQKRQRLKGSLHFLGATTSSRHTVFVDDVEGVRGFDAAKHFDTPAELVGRAYNRPRTAQLDDPALLQSSSSSQKLHVNRCAAAEWYLQAVVPSCRLVYALRSMHMIQIGSVATACEASRSHDLVYE